MNKERNLQWAHDYGNQSQWKLVVPFLEQLFSHLTRNMRSTALHKKMVRGPNLFFKYFYFLFGPGLFYPLRMIATVQNFFGTLVGPLNLLHPKMKLLRCREPREPETLVSLHFSWSQNQVKWRKTKVSGMSEKGPHDRLKP